MLSCTVFIQVIRVYPGGLFQYTEGEEHQPNKNIYSTINCENVEIEIIQKV